MRGGIWAVLFVLVIGSGTGAVSGQDALRERPRIAGRIVDQADRPVAGADVFWCPTTWDRGLSEGTVHGTTGDNGQFQLEAPEEFRIPSDWERIGELWIVAKGYGLEGVAADGFRVKTGGDQKASVKLSAAAPFVLRVVDPRQRVREGDLVEPIYFTIIDSRMQGVNRVRLNLPQRVCERLGGITDGNGEYPVGYLKRGDSIGFRVVSEEYGTQEESSSEARGTVPVVTFRLHPTARIEGTTIGNNKKAFAGARVSFWTHGEDVPDEKPNEVTRVTFRASAVVDENGSFAVPALGPGFLRVAVERPNARTERFDPLKAAVITAPPSVAAGMTAYVTLGTEATTVFWGIVVTEGTNEPVANAGVRLSSRRDQISEGAITDENGQYSITSIAADATLTATTGVVQSRDVVKVSSSPGLKEVVCPPIKLPPTRIISGRLVDSDGKPIADADVIGLEVAIHHGKAKTSSDGRFELLTAAEKTMTGYVVEVNGESRGVSIRNRDPLEIMLIDKEK